MKVDLRIAYEFIFSRCWREWQEYIGETDEDNSQWRLYKSWTHELQGKLPFIFDLIHPFKHLEYLSFVFVEGITCRQTQWKCYKVLKWDDSLTWCSCTHTVIFHVIKKCKKMMKYAPNFRQNFLKLLIGSSWLIKFCDCYKCPWLETSCNLVS